MLSNPNEFPNPCFPTLKEFPNPCFLTQMNSKNCPFHPQGIPKAILSNPKEFQNPPFPTLMNSQKQSFPPSSCPKAIPASQTILSNPTLGRKWSGSTSCFKIPLPSTEWKNLENLGIFRGGLSHCFFHPLSLGYKITPKTC